MNHDFEDPWNSCDFIFRVKMSNESRKGISSLNKKRLSSDKKAFQKDFKLSIA
jgi:hypothetical protein